MWRNQAGRGVGESVPVIPRGRMDRHTGRFIEHQKIFVFIEDIEIHRDRRDFYPTDLFPEQKYAGCLRISAERVLWKGCR